MPPNRPEPGSPDDWLRRAVSDLSIAQSAAGPDILLEDLCFHAQQAAEKSLKSVLVFQGTEVPKTHNIKLLLDLIAAKSEIANDLQSAAILSDYAVTGRYPGEVEPVTKEEHLKAVSIAQLVIDWAKNIISGK